MRSTPKVRKELTLSELKKSLGAAKPYRDKQTNEVIWALDAWIISGSEFSLLGLEIDPDLHMVCIRGDSEPDPEAGIWIETKECFRELHTCISSNLFTYLYSKNVHALT